MLGQVVQQLCLRIYVSLELLLLPALVKSKRVPRFCYLFSLTVRWSALWLQPRSFQRNLDDDKLQSAHVSIDDYSAHGNLQLTLFRGVYTTDQTKKGWLTSILELGAWFGTLMAGFLAESISRKYAILVNSGIFIIGVIIQCTGTQILASDYLKILIQF